jgi:hypothetical protein
MPRQQLEEIARKKPTTIGELAEIVEMRQWQVEALGEELIKSLSLG